MSVVPRARGRSSNAHFFSDSPPMWCRQCQQDVPAARSTSGPPMCMRCRQELKANSAPHGALASLSDCGVELNSFDQAKPSGTTPRPLLEHPPRGADLRRIERILRPVRRDPAHGTNGRSAIAAEEPFGEFAAIGPHRSSVTDASNTGWGFGLLISAGATAFVAGLTLLVAANALVHGVAWRWGFAITTAGEGLLLAGLAAIAVRHSQHSRRMNGQLEGLNRTMRLVRSSFEGRSAWGVEARAHHDADAAFEPAAVGPSLI